MDELTKSLFDFGSIGALAGILLYLHLNAIKNFREEQKEDRKNFREELAEERERCDSQLQNYRSDLKEAINSIGIRLDRIDSKIKC